MTLCVTVALAAVRQEVYVTGTVESFGGYALTEAIEFTASQPGEQEVGRIVVDGMYNGEYPWIMRIYTDNLHFAGVGGALKQMSPGGLISADGQFVIPLQVTCPNFGLGEWRWIPDLNDPKGIPYQPSADPLAEKEYTDCVLMGIDPRNADWVAGPDGLLFSDDDNLLGDTTIPTPFEITLRANFSGGSVKGKYEALVYVEIVPAP